MSDSKTKKIFFWVLVLSFLATAPMLVFYAMGYRFSMERGVFVYSGSVTLKPMPREIDVFIDNRPVPKGVISFLNYSYHIDGIVPGEHSLRVEAPGFYSWYKTIHTHSGLSTEFWNIFLIKEKYEKNKYESGAVDNFFVSPDGKKVALAQNSQTGVVIKILNTKTNKMEYVFPFVGYRFSEENENIEWSPREGRLSVPLRKDGKKFYFIISLGDERSYELNEFLEVKDIDLVRWSPKEKNTVFFLSGGNLMKSDLDEKGKPTIIADNVAGYDFSAGGVYYLSKDNGIVYKKNIFGAGEVNQVTFENVGLEYGGDFRMIVYSKDEIAILDQEKNLYIFNNIDNERSIKRIGGNISGLHFSDDGKKLVFWDKKEIFVYFMEDWESQPIRKKGDLVSLVRFYRDVSNVEWFQDYEHILFTVGNVVKMVELDQRSHQNIYDIVSVNLEKTKIVYEANNGNLLFLDRENADNNASEELYYIKLDEEK